MRALDWHPRQVSIALVAIAGLLGLDALYQIGKAAQWRMWLSEVSAATTPATTQPAGTQPADGATDAKKPPEVAAAIKQRNIFTKPPPTGHGMTLVGVLVNRALFQSRGGGVVGLAVGESGQGIKVTAIDGYQVTIEYEGKSETMQFQTGSGGGGGGGGGRGAPPPRRGRPMAGPPVAVRMAPSGTPSPESAAQEAAQAAEAARMAERKQRALHEAQQRGIRR